MAKECLNDCPIITAIQKNIDADLLPDFFNKGMDSAVKASDECLGPGEKEVMRRNGWRKMVPAEPLKVCGYFDSIQNETSLAS